MEYYLLAIILISIILVIYLTRIETFTKAEINRDLTLTKRVFVNEGEKVFANELETNDLCFMNPEDNSDMVCLTDEDIRVIKNMEKDDTLFSKNKLTRSICVGEECINKDQLRNMTVFWPKGAIFSFSGNLSSIPEGWAVCNGENGTIDLRDRFIQATRDNENIDLDAGVDTINLNMENMPSHQHTFNLNNGGSGTKGDSRGLFWGKIYKKLNNGGADKQPVYKIQNPKDLDNKFGIQQNEVGGESISNLPPYYTLLFIQKIV